MLLFNRYQYEPSTDLIGKGEFTHVYEALDTHIYLPVAVKIYHAQETTEKFGFVQVEKFMALEHPNICRYLHMGEIRKESVSGEMEKSQVCVMELLQDGDFASYYQAHRQPEILRKMVLDILHGLTYLHSQRIVHRRLKASNLLVGMTTQGPVVKITDFGLGSGKATLRDVHFSSMVVEATRMAPEQFNMKEYGINGSVSYHLDFWSLGLAVYEALSDNDALFMNSPGDSREQLIRNILSPRLPGKVLGLPAPFDRLVMRCLAKHAVERPQNTRELIELLAQPITTIYPVYEAPMKESAKGERLRETAVRDPVKVETVEEESLFEAPVKERPIDENILTKTRELVLAEAVTEDIDVVEVAPAIARQLHPFFMRYEYNPGTSLIGKGGFSRVYKAFDKKLDRWVALKFYKTGEFSERYSPIAEIRRVINLDHPNICRYLDIEEIEKENLFREKEKTQISVMELLDGGNLLEYYKAHPTEQVLRKLLTDVLKGLAYLHRNGIIHRDIKPANILIRETPEGPVAKITDFGVSRASNSARTEGSAALVVSIPYMAPEQLNVKRYGIEEKIAFNLDLWSLGVTIYEVVTGNVLFRNAENDSNEEIMANILAPGLQDKIATLPQPFLDVVRRCLVKDARRRAQQAEDLIELLEPKPEPIVIREPVVIREVVTVQAPPFIEEPNEPETGLNEVEARFMESESIRARGVQGNGAETYPGAPADDAFIPELSWTWAETVSAPIIDEPVSGDDVPASKTASVPVSVRMPVELRIGVITGIVLVIISFYIIAQNHRMSAALNALPPKQEAAGIINPVSATISAGREKPQEARVELTEAEPLLSPAKFTVVLSSAKTCSVHINDTPYGILEGGKSMKIYLDPGDYTIHAASVGNHPTHFTQQLVVQEKNLNHWHKFRIKL